MDSLAVKEIREKLEKLPPEDREEVRGILFEYFNLCERVLKMPIVTRLLFFECNYLMFKIIYKAKLLNRYVGEYPATLRELLDELFGRK